jgi:hypothetical protein
LPTGSGLVWDLAPVQCKVDCRCFFRVGRLSVRFQHPAGVAVQQLATYRWFVRVISVVIACLIHLCFCRVRLQHYNAFSLGFAGGVTEVELSSKQAVHMCTTSTAYVSSTSAYYIMGIKKWIACISECRDRCKLDRDAPRSRQIARHSTSHVLVGQLSYALGA